jgi:hypothetical protein
MLIISLLIYFMSSFAGWAILTIRATRHLANSELAFMLAEAGVEYYRWHLAHDQDDFQDGTGEEGPYVHDYYDKDGTLIGTFTLDITAPPIGSTLVTIKSTGSPASATNIRRAIETQLGKPSWAQYAVVASAAMRFGTGTEAFGRIHSNGGVRFDGLAHNLITSAQSDYDDPDHTGTNEFGVHTHVSPVDPTPPTAVPNRTDVFEAGREFPVPAVDFSGITADLAEIKADAQEDGEYFAASGSLGYHIDFNTDDTFDLYVVTATDAPPSNCTNYLSETNWGTWSIAGETYVDNYPLPENGLIFTEDHTWVSGQIDTARVTVGAGTFPVDPATYKNIIANNDLTYTNYDGQDAIALIAQGNFHVGWAAESDLRIDAAILAQNGRAGRYYYRPPGGGQDRCSPYHSLSSLTLYGMIGTLNRYGFAWSDGTGYASRFLIYDAELLYAPPPSFPLTSDQYQTVSWREVTP